jgi:uncharacterized repeat protein (TIGR03803 family)
VFKLTHKSSGFVFNPLYSFLGGDDGAGTRSGVTFGSDGSLFGATIAGGGGSGCSFGYPGCGTVFNLRPPATACKSALCPWTETVLHRFSISDGDHPYGDLISDGSNLYGITYKGGTSNDDCGGTIYKMTPSSDGWTESVLYSFTGEDDGCQPHFLTGDHGNLYTTAIFVGAHNGGTFFELMAAGSSWNPTILYAFSDPYYPVGSVIFDNLGDAFGTTISAGTGEGGTIFELTPGGGLSVLYNFSGPPQGCGPQANLAMDNLGNLYGTTLCDGAYQKGSVFKLTPSNGGNWTETDLYSFSGGSDGAYPFSSVVFDADSNLYGTASQGGNLNCNPPSGCGVVWKITP